MKNQSLKLPTIWSLTCLNRNNGGEGKAMLLPTTLWRSAFWRTMLLRTRAAAVLLIICILAGTSLYGSEGSITIAVVMAGSNQEDRAPLQVYLSKAMGQPVIIASPDSYGATVAGLADRSYDFACLGALVYIRAHAKYGVTALVQRSSDLQYRTVFITGAGSSIHSLKDLRGRQFAFGDINSTSAHMVPYYELKQAGINPETDLRYRYSGSHLATAALVANGAVDAGAIDKTFFDFLISGGKLDSTKVRVFYTSEPYLDYVWVARKDLPKAERERFSRSLLALQEGKGEDDSVLKILRALKFVIANDEEYAITRRMGRKLGMF
jgi:phosphonate transport system substrate-binding protein